MLHAFRRIVAAHVLSIAIGAAAACPTDSALARMKHDFVSGPWRGFAIFDPDNGRFRACSAGTSSDETPWLIWSRWDGAVELSVRNAPWTLREGQGFTAVLSIDDTWHADATAKVMRGSDAAEPPIFSIIREDVETLLRNGAGGRRLTIQRAGEKPLFFSLSGAHRMLASLERCYRRGVALQRKSDEGDQKAADFFVAQQDADAFAQWADELSKSAHMTTALLGVGDGVSRVAERLSRGEVESQFATFLLRIIVTPVAKTIGNARRELSELEEFDPASGDRDLGVVLRAMTEGLLERAEDMLRDSRLLMTAVGQGDRKEMERLYVGLARQSYLSYLSDNIYLLIRNASRDNEHLEYHLNRASRSINLMNIALVNAILLSPDDALAAEMPALIASSREHIGDVRRWARSGRAILAARTGDIMRMEESEDSRRSLELLRAYAKSLEEEEALADRFDAALAEVETALRRGPEPNFWRLAHGGQNSAATLLQRRFALRMKRRSAAEALRTP